MLCSVIIHHDIVCNPRRVTIICNRSMFEIITTFWHHAPIIGLLSQFKSLANTTQKNILRSSSKNQSHLKNLHFSRELSFQIIIFILQQNFFEEMTKDYFSTKILGTRKNVYPNTTYNLNVICVWILFNIFTLH